MGRDCPGAEELRQKFCKHEGRSQRCSDGTVSVKGVRFELPGQYLSLEKVAVRFARWDLAHVWLVDGRTDTVLCPSFRWTESAMPTAGAGDRLARSLRPHAARLARHNADMAAQLRTAYRQKDLAQVVHLAHALKGAAGNLGEVQIQAAAAGVEQAARQEPAPPPGTK